MIKVCSRRSTKRFSKLTYELIFERSWEEVSHVEKNIPCNTNQQHIQRQRLMKISFLWLEKGPQIVAGQI